MNIKPFKCEMCFRKFSEKGTLKTHLKVHSELRPFICSAKGCNKTFRSNSNLKNHQKLHENKKSDEFSPFSNDVTESEQSHMQIFNFNLIDSLPDYKTYDFNEDYTISVMPEIFDLN
jgi:uncharacterized Zn-finger protein